MSQSRDRLVRPVDFAQVFARQRRQIRENGGLFVEDRDANLFALSRSTVRRQTMTTNWVTATRTAGYGRGRFGTSRTGNGSMRARNASVTPGRENIAAERGRGTTTAPSVLPSWYLRTPFRDITHTVRTIERRNARLREIEDQPSEGTSPLGENVPDQSLTKASAQLVHNACMITPDLAVSVKVRTSFLGKVPKVRFGFSNENDGESEVLTPQKKLLNSIETVEKVVTAELQRLKRTPSARKAEREKKIRTLMSMR